MVGHGDKFPSSSFYPTLFIKTPLRWTIADGDLMVLAYWHVTSNIGDVTVWFITKTLIFILLSHSCHVFIGGNILAAMAEGVKNADVIVMCYSRKYKSSACCQQGV